MKVRADIINAKLDIQNSLNKFTFRYDKTDNAKIEMSVVQNKVLKMFKFNNGNNKSNLNYLLFRSLTPSSNHNFHSPNRKSQS